MNLTYWYGEETYIKLSLKNWKEITQEIPNYIWIDCCEDIYEMFRYLEKLQNEHHEHFDPVQDMVTRDIERLFSDNSVVIYIPAGRSMITLLSTQLNIFTVQWMMFRSAVLTIVPRIILNGSCGLKQVLHRRRSR